ncbi:uncharacterized protein EI90DRAFT_2598324 [Cantharellus anzutake]|uniref:uncharacterized protein n=1 Tax=Cantharellus anzutake TaxID=1750568 RepID=UPI001908FB23|nr:uncharacterized protein EI90DRAFT_2598324 [Cantharellus anzutake]KAF8320529.1 hypothetical protein EI90DRAFT_2598324 [Cantharellus anzutake]
MQAIAAVSSSAFQPESIIIPIPPATDKAVKQILLGLEIIVRSSKFPLLEGPINAMKMVVSAELKREEGQDVNALRLALTALESVTPLLQLQSIQNTNEDASNFAGRVSNIAAEYAIDVNYCEKAIGRIYASPLSEDKANSETSAPDPNQNSTPPPANGVDTSLSGTTGVEKVPSLSKFDDITARLKQWKEDFELCLTVHSERGLRRFRAAAITILNNIHRNDSQSPGLC